MISIVCISTSPLTVHMSICPGSKTNKQQQIFLKINESYEGRTIILQSQKGI